MNNFAPRPIDLSAYTLHQHQELFLAHALPRMFSDETGKKYLYSSPTGTGKSLMFLSAVARDPYAWGITPRLEIIRDMLVKCGHLRREIDSLSLDSLVDLALSYRITTPIRMRNMLAKGTFPVSPQSVWRLIEDECHHHPQPTIQELLAFIPWVTVVGLTATPFRGTPKGTKEFLDMWDEYTPIMSIPEAAQHGFMSIPEFTIWPLVDDDQIEIVNGEFRTESAVEATASRYAELVQRIFTCNMLNINEDFDSNIQHMYEYNVWDKPTLFAVSSREQANTLAEYLNSEGMPSASVTQNTSDSDRARIFRGCLDCTTAIVQIGVVSEGVDLAIRRIIDLRPTQSPVYWLQLVGRSTRPNGNSEYICCNRNIERHAYLFEGMIPSSKVAEAQSAFGSPSARLGQRVVGLEGLGRFQAAPIHYADNCVGAVYCLYSIEGAVKREFGVVLHPNLSEPIYAEKVSTADENGERQWGKWRKIEAIPGVLGFASTPAKTVTDKQKQSFERFGRRFGMDVTKEINRRNIQAYFILRDLYPNGFRS